MLVAAFAPASTAPIIAPVAAPETAPDKTSAITSTALLAIPLDVLEEREGLDEREDLDAPEDFDERDVLDEPPDLEEEPEDFDELLLAFELPLLDLLLAPDLALEPPDFEALVLLLLADDLLEALDVGFFALLAAEDLPVARDFEALLFGAAPVLTAIVTLAVELLLRDEVFEPDLLEPADLLEPDFFAVLDDFELDFFDTGIFFS